MEDPPKPDPVKDKLFESIVAAVATVPTDVLQQVTAEQVTGIMTRTDTPAEGSGDVQAKPVEKPKPKPKPSPATEAVSRRRDAANRVDFSQAFWVRTIQDPEGTVREAYAYVTFEDGLRVCLVGKIRPLCAGKSYIPGIDGWSVTTPAAQVTVIDGLQPGGVFPDDDRYPTKVRTVPTYTGPPSFETVGSGVRPVRFSAARRTAAMTNADFTRSMYVNVSARSNDTKQAFVHYTLPDGWRVCLVGHIHPLRGRGMRILGLVGARFDLEDVDVDVIDSLPDGGQDTGDEKKPKWT